ncbi:energy transducer TonB [Sphingomonas sp. EC-HK361]|uniref:energy transducer TonB n=1 Tax=Sphingomonas sp. EC-HK361 TaxID=2038397 RepID=UPI0018FE7F5E|nr:energy transducer TonB [Sphingomonas sp. EC-HK361]
MADPAALSPSGKWTLDYGKDACRLSRDYGEGDARITAVFERGGTGEGAALYFILPRGQADIPVGKATIRIEPQAITQRPYFEIWTANPTHPHRVLRTWLDADDLATLTSATALKIDAGPVRLAIAPKVTAATLSALSKCNDDLLQGWGMDLTERDRVATPAQPTTDRAGWITHMDYPQEALRKGEQGMATIIWEIDVDGRVRGCHAAVSSGSAALDDASCRVVTTRARYRPAIGKDGKPMITHEFRRVNWSIPR